MVLICALTLAGVGAVSPSAQAAQGCGGVFLRSWVYGDGYAQVDVYLENGTTNCLVNRTRGASWGKARWMGVHVNLGSRDTGVCGYGSVMRDRDDDCGYYSYYAGPVRIYAPGRCISFGAAVKPPSGPTRVKMWLGKHCG